MLDPRRTFETEHRYRELALLPYKLVIGQRILGSAARLHGLRDELPPVGEATS